jgi:hypothetical protein
LAKKEENGLFDMQQKGNIWQEMIGSIALK